MIDRIRYTGILGYAVICEIDLALCIQSNVFKQSITANGIINVRLRLFVQVDNLGIAATLKVKYAVVIPAMLVITDQKTLRIGRQSGLSGTGQAEEDSGVLAVHICICGAVHGSDAFQRQVVVHHGEHTLLHLTAIPGVNDNLLTAGNVEHSSCLRI